MAPFKTILRAAFIALSAPSERKKNKRESVIIYIFELYLVLALAAYNRVFSISDSPW
jgi:hypothetical protein